MFNATPRGRARVRPEAADNAYFVPIQHQSSSRLSVWPVGLIVGVSCLLCSSALPGVWSFLRVTPVVQTCGHYAGCINTPMQRLQRVRKRHQLQKTSRRPPRFDMAADAVAVAFTTGLAQWHATALKCLSVVPCPSSTDGPASLFTNAARRDIGMFP